MSYNFLIKISFPVVQESLKSELERESSVRADLSKKLTESEASLKSIQAKSKQLINALRQQVAEHSEIRVSMKLSNDFIDIFFKHVLLLYCLISVQDLVMD